MTCELFGVDLKLIGFSEEPACIYEGQCPFANSTQINKAEVSESCQALKDVKDGNSETIEDILQDSELRTLLSIRGLN